VNRVYGEGQEGGQGRLCCFNERYDCLFSMEELWTALMGM